MKAIEEKYQEMKKRVLEIGRGYVKEVDYSKPRSIAEYIDPELKEGSEDEKIRTTLIDYFIKTKEEVCQETFFEIPIDNIIAWLEKQKISEATAKSVDKMVAEFADTKEECTNSKPVNCQIRSYKQGITDALRAFSLDRETVQDALSTENEKGKIEPKFHEGDWITCEELNTAKIISIDGVDADRYEVECIDGTKGFPHVDYVDRNFHLWTINDAKDGDVLATKKGNPFIYDKDRYNNGLAYYYAGLDVNKELTLKSPHHMLAHFGELRSVSPATKEQRDILMKAMADAGYTFDFEKKELKLKELTNQEETKPSNQETSEWSKDDAEILSMLIELVESKEESMEVKVELISWLKDLKKRVQSQPKQEWSEDDEEFLNRAIKATKPMYPITANWLKSLKGHVLSQLKQEWSKEDESLFDLLHHCVCRCISDPYWEYSKREKVSKEIIPFIEKLKFLRPYKQWKPTQEQLDALKWQLENINENSWQYKATEELYNQLNEL